jgi:hypothetical protein
MKSKLTSNFQFILSMAVLLAAFQNCSGGSSSPSSGANETPISILNTHDFSQIQQIQYINCTDCPQGPELVVVTEGSQPQATVTFALNSNMNNCTSPIVSLASADLTYLKLALSQVSFVTQPTTSACPVGGGSYLALSFSDGTESKYNFGYGSSNCGLTIQNDGLALIDMLTNWYNYSCATTSN